ncbi:CaiB/BaiF CoA transferase family protein [Halomonas mongoliensis]|uniref:CaiB/BaiF CoA transferase family protein n=1 Tax=Halomonas mongoliensis TaxID=321265 RepID=UPI00403AF489
MAGPLTGIRVLDLSRVMAGPWCTQVFADMGAEVIKVERPGVGDDTRQWGPPWLKDREGKETRESAYYLSANRGKHSVTVNLASEEGQKLVREIAASSDILVENFKTGTLAAKGLGYEDLAAINPGLIYCSITGFGQTGPMAQAPGYDYLVQAQGGLMSITGVADGDPGAGPQRVGMAVADLTTGMNSAIAILGALHHRQRTGEGQFIDMALLDVQVSWLANQALNYFCSGEVPVRTGETHPNVVPYQPFPTLDGEKIIIAVGNDRQFKNFCAVAGRAELADDPRFLNNAERVKHRDILVPILCEITCTRSIENWKKLLEKVGVPCGPVQDIRQVFDDAQVKARGMKVELDSEHGRVPGVANPVKYSKSKIEYHKPPPGLGEDTVAVLRGVLNKSDDDIANLREQGVI